MENLNLYCVNNHSGVDVGGLKDSVYDIPLLYENKSNHSITVLEEDPSLNGSSDKLKNLSKVIDINRKIFQYADALIKKGYTPLAFGGDHAMAIGTVSATANNYDNIGLIWVDAHSDINTPDSSPSGNIHGMPVSCLLGQSLTDFFQLGNPQPKVKAENIVYIGLRSVDPGELEAISELGITAYYYTDVQAMGIKKVLEQTLAKLAGCQHLHLSFDFDVMDPLIFPAVSTAVPQGLTQEDVLYLFEKLIATDKLRAIDLVEYNKGHDIEGKSLAFVKELLRHIEKNTSKLGARIEPYID